MTNKEKLQKALKDYKSSYIILEFRNGTLGYIMNDVIKYRDSDGGFDYISYLADDLTWLGSDGTNHDVINVYIGCGYGVSHSSIFENRKHFKNILSINQVKEVTIQEIADVFGIEVENLKIKK